MASSRLLLASQSPRRRDILTTLGLPFDAEAVDADETELPGEAPGPYLERIVAKKLDLAIPVGRRWDARAVVVADTTVVVDETMLAKPVDEADNVRMVKTLVGRTHEVRTRFAVADLVGGRGSLARTVVTKVHVRPLSEEQIARYVASGEGRDKAGGYAIQGLGSFAVSAIEGSYANVVGLPAAELVESLLELGIYSSFPLTPTS
jgi:septum formation protein